MADTSVPHAATAIPSTPPAAVAAANALAWLRVVAIAAVVGPALLLTAVTWYLYRQAFSDARQQLGGTVSVATEHALKLFETNEMLLQRMLDLLGDRDDPTILARGREIHEQLKKMADGLPQIQGLFVNGGDARMLASSRVYPPVRDIDYSDRELFRVHRDQRGVLFITEQLVSRSTGEPFFDLSRRREFADGTFAGIVSSSMRPNYLTQFYERLAESLPGLLVGVLRNDGRVLASWPSPRNLQLPAESALAKRFAAGEHTGIDDGPSPFDGIERLRVFRRLDPYPLYVVAALDRSVVLAGWWRQVGLIALFTFPTAAGFAWMAWLALRRTRTQLDAMQRLGEETSHRQRIELALQQSQKLEAMGRLTGGVAHDFNNLLMIVGSNSYVLQLAHADLAGNAQLAAIDRAVASGAKVTRQLLAFMRRQALLPERITLQERLPALLDLLRPLLGRSILLASSIAPETGAIEVDPAELELAIINLAVNAKDAMPDGGRLTISAHNAPEGEPDSNASYIVLEVADTGCGMEKAVLDRAFEPFFTTKPIGHGTGLGLSQVQALCQSGGGSVRIDSRPGEGTRVSLYFRRAGQPNLVTQAEDRRAFASLDCCVLLVEDNQAVAQAVQSLLQSMGCVTTLVGNAEAARDYIDANPEAVDVVLSDIEMPGNLDGIALATLLTARHPRLPVVLMTGYAGRLEQARRQRFEVLPKPCSFETLMDAIHRAAARRRGAPAEAAIDPASPAPAEPSPPRA